MTERFWSGVREAWSWLPMGIALGVWVVFAYYVEPARIILYFVLGIIAFLLAHYRVRAWLASKEAAAHWREVCKPCHDLAIAQGAHWVPDHHPNACPRGYVHSGFRDENERSDARTPKRKDNE